MIGKIITGKSFRGCLSYCLEEKRSKSLDKSTKERAEIILFNQCFGNKKELIEQFNDVRQLNRDLSKAVWHLTLSLPPGEKLSKEQLASTAADCATHFGFDKNQFVAIEHNDTNHQHIHLVVNRIGFDGKTVSDSNSYKRMADFCRNMEKKYQLQQVLSPRAFQDKSQRQIKRYDSRKEQFKMDIVNSLSKATSYQDFEEAMKQKGYDVMKGRGIAFTDRAKVYFKGSQLGYSLSRIEDVLNIPVSQRQRHIVAGIVQRQKLQQISQVKPSSKSASDLFNKPGTNGPSQPLHFEILPKVEQQPEDIPYELRQKTQKRRSMRR